jgi:hypothetical protein
MTWQEELRKLDSALAGGELAANEYRKRRDEILAAASSAQPPSPVLGPPAGPRPAGAESDNGEVTQSETEQANEADSTQIISDPTKSVEQPAAEPAAQQKPAAEPEKPVAAEQDAGERTQVITTEERTAPSVPQPQAPWAAHRPDHAGPAAPAGPGGPGNPGGAFPVPAQPMLPAPAVTPMDAQDLFTSNKAPRGGGKKPWLVALVLIVVLAVAGGAVWWFALRDDNTDNSGNTADQPGNTEQTEEPVPPFDVASITLPGEAAKNGGEMDIAKAGELKVIAPSEAALLADAGVGPVAYAGSTDGNYRYLLYSYASDNPEQAKELTEAVAGVQEQIGLKAVDVKDVADGVQVTGLTNNSAAVLRGLYTYGDTTIQLSVLQVPTGDDAELASQFAAALRAVTDAAPPAE